MSEKNKFKKFKKIVRKLILFDFIINIKEVVEYNILHFLNIEKNIFFVKRHKIYITWSLRGFLSKFKKKDINTSSKSRCHSSQDNQNPKIAVYCHLFMLDLLDEFYEYINNIDYDYDLFINICTDNLNDIKLIKEKFPNSIIIINPNIGRDVAGFIDWINKTDLEKYDLVCKIHTKKSIQIENGDLWRKYLLDSLLGNPKRVCETISYFEKNQKCTMIGPAEFRSTVSWGKNKDNYLKITKQYNLPKTLDFFAGTMFWCRPKILKPIKNEFSFDSFRNQEHKLDGNIEHAFERIFGSLARKDGGEMKSFSIYL